MGYQFKYIKTYVYSLQSILYHNVQQDKRKQNDLYEFHKNKKLKDHNSLPWMALKE